MSKLVVLNLGAGNLNDGFPNVIAQLRLKDGKIEQFIGSLPPAPELATLNQQWQLLYYALHQRFDVARRRLFEVEEEGLTNISVRGFQELCQEIETKFNLWLDSPSFLKVDRKLRTKLDQNEEVQIIIETGDRTLHRFPWHLWHFLEDYQQAEIGLSNLEYSPINLEKKQRNKPRILTILGHSEGINVKADQALIAQINNAEIVFLVEPKSAEFHEILWDEKGWDILFFAGHSHTENHQGIIFINPQESLNIKELKTAINKAIKQGLQLAIFNSCDGIGLAEELSKLNLPQIIVMREGVPDLIAQEFLKYFLSALQQNKSVFCSLREARERLQAWDNDFPGGSWLPMICQNLSIPNDSIFKISFDDKIEVPKKNKPNIKILFYSILLLLILFFAVKNYDNYSLNKLSSIISNLLVNNQFKPENITFEEEGKILIENLYQALSNKDFALAETFHDVSLKQQFNPDFFKQFSKVTVDNLEVTYQDMNMVKFIGENNYTYLDNTYQTEKRNYTVSKIDNQLQITSSNFIEVMKPR